MNRLENSQVVRTSSCFKRTFRQEITNAFHLMIIHSYMLKAETKLSEKEIKNHCMKKGMSLTSPEIVVMINMSLFLLVDYNCYF